MEAAWRHIVQVGSLVLALLLCISENIIGCMSLAKRLFNTFAPFELV